jgi:hypothetical protein
MTFKILSRRERGTIRRMVERELPQTMTIARGDPLSTSFAGPPLPPGED